MRLIFCIIIFCSLLVSSAPIPATQNSKIAIIGGGASGVSAGFLLKQYGYKSVTIYEGKNELGGFALTLNIQGNAYDLATMFIPDASILGPGIPPVLKKMVDFSGLQLVEAEDFQTLHLPERKLSRFPEILEKYPAELLKVQLVEGFKEMTKLLQCSANGVDCIKCGVCKDLTETTIQFGIRKNLTAFAELLTYTGDGLGVGPAAFGWIGGSLVSHFWWTPLEIYRCLKFLGVTAKTLPPDVPPALKAMFLANNGTGSKHWWHFKDGYQTFWKVLAERAKISTRLSQQVLSVARSLDGKKWVVTTSKGKEDYDFVISTAAPQDAIKYLPNGQQKTLLEGATPQVPPNDMYLATVNDYPKTLPGTVAFWPEGLGVGTHKLRIDGTPFFWQKRHGSPIILAGTYTGPNQTPEQVWEVVKQWTSANLGFHLDKLLRSYRIVFPSGPHADIRPQWYQTWPTLQGDNGLFVFGEPMCGSGVPVITQCLSSVLPRYFPNQVKYLKDNQASSPSTSWISFVVGLPTGIAIAALVTLFIYKTRSRRTEEISTNLLL